MATAMPMVAADDTCLIDTWTRSLDKPVVLECDDEGDRQAHLLPSEAGDDGRTLGAVTLVNAFASRVHHC